MLWEMMFKYIARRAVEVLMITITLAVITYCLWAFVDAIAPYQVAYQALK